MKCFALLFMMSLVWKPQPQPQPTPTPTQTDSTTSLEMARDFYLAPTKLDGCKRLVNTPAARAVGITLEACMSSVEPAEKDEVLVPSPMK
jgi:hypothetical protein